MYYDQIEAKRNGLLTEVKADLEQLKTSVEKIERILEDIPSGNFLMSENRFEDNSHLEAICAYLDSVHLKSKLIEILDCQREIQMRRSDSVG